MSRRTYCSIPPSFMGIYGRKTNENDPKSLKMAIFIEQTSKLDQTTFPEYKDFFSSLKQRNVLELPVDKEHNMEICIQMGHQQYTILKEMFTLNGWTMREFLIYYNNLDTKPFVEAVGNYVKYYEDRGVDLFKEALSGKYLKKVLIDLSDYNFPFCFVRYMIP